MNERPDRTELRPPASARESEEERRRRMDEVRRRLETGELDSDVAAIETAYALLDGDRPLA